MSDKGIRSGSRRYCHIWIIVNKSCVAARVRPGMGRALPYDIKEL